MPASLHHDISHLRGCSWSLVNDADDVLGIAVSGPYLDIALLSLCSSPDNYPELTIRPTQAQQKSYNTLHQHNRPSQFVVEGC